MTTPRLVLAAVFVLCVALGTWLDATTPRTTRAAGVLVADLHVHPFPGDGALTVAQLQREAARRGVDVIAVTGHNNRFGLELGELLGSGPTGVIVLPGQEITTPGFHMIAAGIREVVSWRLSAAEAIASVHAQGGIAIAAHPVERFHAGFSAALSTLDGAEVGHPMASAHPQVDAELRAFFARTQAARRQVAPIGSSDFHTIAPLGGCRTYLLTGERTAGAVLAAIRAGRTVARCEGGPLVGIPEHVAIVSGGISDEGKQRPSAAENGVALLAVAALIALVLGGTQTAGD